MKAYQLSRNRNSLMPVIDHNINDYVIAHFTIESSDSQAPFR